MTAKAAAKLVKVRILADGVFPFEDVRKDTGDIVDVSEATAATLEKNKSAKRV